MISSTRVRSGDRDKVSLLGLSHTCLRQCIGKRKSGNLVSQQRKKLRSYSLYVSQKEISREGVLRKYKAKSKKSFSFRTKIGHHASAISETMSTREGEANHLYDVSMETQSLCGAYSEHHGQPLSSKMVIDNLDDEGDADESVAKEHRLAEPEANLTTKLFQAQKKDDSVLASKAETLGCHESIC